MVCSRLWRAVNHACGWRSSASSNSLSVADRLRMRLLLCREAYTLGNCKRLVVAFHLYHTLKHDSVDTDSIQHVADKTRKHALACVRHLEVCAKWKSTDEHLRNLASKVSLVDSNVADSDSSSSCTSSSSSLKSSRQVKVKPRRHKARGKKCRRRKHGAVRLLCSALFPVAVAGFSAEVSGVATGTEYIQRWDKLGTSCDNSLEVSARPQNSQDGVHLSHLRKYSVSVQEGLACLGGERVSAAAVRLFVSACVAFALPPCNRGGTSFKRCNQNSQGVKHVFPSACLNTLKSGGRRAGWCIANIAHPLISSYPIITLPTPLSLTQMVERQLLYRQFSVKATTVQMTGAEPS